MQILFEAFYYTDDYYDLVESGIVPEDLKDYELEKHTVLKKILINPALIIVARPDGKYTTVSDGLTTYLLNIQFTDYCKLVGFTAASTLKKRWAN